MLNSFIPFSFKLESLFFSLLIVTLFSHFSCSSYSDQKSEDESSEQPTSVNFVGDYVSEGYALREDGYDWMVVRILENSMGELTAQVSSRSDLKRPSCHWQTHLESTGTNSLSSSFMDQNILFELVGDSLYIKGENSDGDDLLYFFCNGGGTLKGSYVKLDEELDLSQINNYTFDQSLSLQGIDFEIKATEQNPFTTLEIDVQGLEINTEPLLHEVNGGYIKSEIEDLNSDGWPELLVYFNTYGLEMNGFLIGYSVNNGKSISRISMPEMTEVEMTGYRGQDEFAIVETSLVRRFPIFEKVEENWVSTGKMKQLEYKLRNGEASREFFVVNISEY